MFFVWSTQSLPGACTRARARVLKTAVGLRRCAVLAVPQYLGVLGALLERGGEQRACQASYFELNMKKGLSPRTLSLFYMENTSVHRKVCRRMV